MGSLNAHIVAAIDAFIHDHYDSDVESIHKMRLTAVAHDCGVLSFGGLLKVVTRDKFVDWASTPTRRAGLVVEQWETDGYPAVVIRPRSATN